jgi:hypothetical protein
MAERPGFKQLTLQDRLSAWAKKTREKANELKPGPFRDELLQKAAQADDPPDRIGLIWFCDLSGVYALRSLRVVSSSHSASAKTKKAAPSTRSEQRSQVMKERPLKGLSIAGHDLPAIGDGPRGAELVARISTRFLSAVNSTVSNLST